MLSSDNRILLPLGVFLVALAGSLILMSYVQNKGAKQEENDPHPFPEILSQEYRLGEKGITRLEDIGNGYKLIYFGTVYGSDSYPVAFETLTKIQSYKFKKPVHTIFVTLDPKRDTEELIQATTELYQSPILTMRGDQEKIESLAKKFGVRMERTYLPDSRLEYTMDLSPWMYLTTPDFRILGAYPTQIRIERLKMEIEAHMKREHPTK